MLVGASLLIAMGYGLVAPVLPVFARSFDVSVTASSALISAFALARLVFAPLGGSMVTRFGRRPVYLIGLTVVAASSAACAVADSFAQLLLFRAVGGIGSTMFTISAMGLLVRLAPAAQRGRASGLYGSAFLLGGVVGPVVGSLTSGWGLRVPFVVYAVLLMAAVVAVAVFLREPADDPVGTAVDAAETPGEAGDRRVTPGAALEAPLDLRGALARGPYRAALVSNFAHGWANMGVRIALVPLFAAAVAESVAVGDPELARWTPGLALTTFALGTMAAVNVVGPASDRVGRRPFLLGGLAAGAVLTVLFGLVGGVVTLIVASALAGVAAGAVGPAQQAAVADVSASRARVTDGKVLAVFQMAGDAGQIVGPLLAGMLVDEVGYGAAFGLSGVLLAVGAGAWLLVREPRLER